MKKYLAQKGGTCCVVYAVANCMRYLGLPHMDISEAKAKANCKYGPAVNPPKVVRYMKAPLKATNSPKEIFNQGGILIIMHPIYNLHAVFCEPSKDKNIVVVNSYLGPLVAKFSKEILIKFLPKHKINNKHYYIKKGVEK